MKTRTAPRTDPSERGYRTKWARAHLVRNVADSKMWRLASAVLFPQIRRRAERHISGSL
jgi:hypothetical protein